MICMWTFCATEVSELMKCAKLDNFQCHQEVLSYNELFFVTPKISNDCIRTVEWFCTMQVLILLNVQHCSYVILVGSVFAHRNMVDRVTHSFTPS